MVNPTCRSLQGLISSDSSLKMFILCGSLKFNQLSQTTSVAFYPYSFLLLKFITLKAEEAAREGFLSVESQEVSQGNPLDFLCSFSKDVKAHILILSLYCVL